jgi:hypothetical protein
MAKFWHIIIALIASLILSCIFHWIGWDWTRWPIGILFAIYFVAILFSHHKNPVPLSREADDRYDAYWMYCWAKQKKGSTREYASGRSWLSELPYPEDVVAAFGRAQRAQVIPEYKHEFLEADHDFQDVCVKHGLDIFKVWATMLRWGQ